MGLTHSPRIVTDGLVFCLDAANKLSYAGTGNTWTDLVGGNNGTLTNGPTFSEENGGSLVFDGANDYVELVDKDLFSFGDGVDNFAKSVSFWFKVDDASHTVQSIVAKDNYSGQREWNMGIYSASRMRFFLKGNLSGASQFGRETSGILQSGTWHHCVCTFDGINGDPSGMKIYIDGNREDIYNSGVATGQVCQNGTAPLTVGRSHASYSQDGNFSNLLVYNKELTASEITQNYKALKGRFT
jgi:hypothetical protein